MAIALIGPSGAGKGTQAFRISSQLKLFHISTGDLFRDSLEQRTALGLLAKRYMRRGDLIPDEVVDSLIEERLLKTAPNQEILFDGFPSTLYQAEFLDKLLEEAGRKLEAVIYLQAPDEEVIARLPGRLICRTCQAPYHVAFNPPSILGVCDRCQGELYQRADDTVEIGRERLKLFHRVTEPLINYYKQSGRLVIVKDEGNMDDVTQALINTIAAVRRNKQQRAKTEEALQLQALKEDAKVLAPDQAAYPSLDVVLLGAPGSGKGTQADQLKSNLGLQHISTGDLFRENLKNETELGKLAKTYMERGELVPDDVTQAMVRDRLQRPDTRAGFILDGFPRTLPQAEALSDMLTDMQRRLDAVLYIKVSDEEIIKRLSGRRICCNCQTPYHMVFNPPAEEGKCDRCGGELYQRKDDNEETIMARLKTFHGQTAPLIGYYRQAGLLFEIEGEGDVADITARTMAAIQPILQPLPVEWSQQVSPLDASDVEMADL